ncbi:MAG: DMT family transporter [Kiritimatiellae bacterium]|nr:DMT family transporter [Kiritimatiellia bacterium]
MSGARGPVKLGALPALVAAVVFFASIPIFLKYFARTLDAWTVNGIRYAFAALFWLPFVVAAKARSAMDRRIWRDAVPPAAVNIIGQAAFALSPYYNDASVVGFVGRSSFLFAIVFGFWLLPRERPLARQPMFWIGACGTLAGLAALYAGGVRVGATSPLGLTILLITALTWGLYSVLVGRRMMGYPTRLAFGVISLYTAAGLLVLLFLFGDWRRAAGAGWRDWGLLWGSALIGIAFGHVFMYRAIRDLGPIITEGGLLLNPFVTSLGAFIFLGERMGGIEWVGGVLLVLGSFLLLAAKRQSVRDLLLEMP